MTHFNNKLPAIKSSIVTEFEFNNGNFTFLTKFEMIGKNCRKLKNKYGHI